MNKKILIADDEEVVHTIVKRALTASHFQCVSALNGQDAVDMAQDEKPDLILLDLNMPKKNGRETIKELRRNIQTQMIPIIMLTGSSELADKLVGFELGADDYITKPFQVEELIARVQSIFRRSKQNLSANPLTRLPGNPSIEEEVNTRIREKSPFALYYLDIDQFKAFNDVYGYAKGDQVIQDTAEIFSDIVGRSGDPYRFLGHVGGDDFVIVSHPMSIPKIADPIVTRFDSEIPLYYSEEDRKNGYVTTHDRMGREQKFPLMSLSVAIVSNEKRTLDHYARVVDLAAEIKRFLKSKKDRTGSIYFLDRRSG